MHQQAFLPLGTSIQVGCPAGENFIRIESCPDAVVGGLRLPDGVSLQPKHS